MVIADYHVHSNFSSDGQASMDEMAQKAIRLGLKRLCFTDHMDYDYPKVSDFSFVFDIEEQQKKLQEIKERYRSEIEILNGVELGLQPHIKDQMEALVSKYPFDFVIGSTHVVDHVDPYYPKFWENTSEEEGIRRYFQEIIDNCRLFSNFHVCGHIDYIVRYIPTTITYRKDLRADLNISENRRKWEEANAKIYSIYSYENYADLLDELLKTLLSLGKGIEVNSSGLRNGLRYPHPRIEVLKRYRELGGELITIGSDAHSPEQLGFEFPKIEELLKSLGYRYYACFKEGKPVMEKL